MPQPELAVLYSFDCKMLMHFPGGNDRVNAICPKVHGPSLLSPKQPEIPDNQRIAGKRRQQRCASQEHSERDLKIPVHQNRRPPCASTRFSSRLRRRSPPATLQPFPPDNKNQNHAE